ncbi:hypothetical protein [Paenibacillus arenilitoris]|uniref:Sporulation protein n=1 Tax=Paenibacillus arenilitoris TaxID=2772299 RepID=A0A927CQD5_9BACL|nr:hypothetical protein [Paenibacillus arenilitoris]MBD2871590.1 hypothetical protein [Paenibacillus arenilitoris]
MQQGRLSGLRKWIAAFAVCLIVLLFGGCANQSSDRVKTYGHDGYMGLSNSNPNMPGRHMALNYESDGNLVEQVLRPLKGIKNTQIVFNGTDLHVNLKVDRSLSDTEVRKLRSKAQFIVQKNMPRYDVHVETAR